jgi:hypothetical protein
MRSILFILWWLLYLAAASSAGLFISQGGFGGGHLRFDYAIYLLSLPWGLLPWPEPLLKHDFIWILILPWFFNALLLLAITRLIAAVSRRGK